MWIIAHFSDWLAKAVTDTQLATFVWIIFKSHRTHETHHRQAFIQIICQYPPMNRVIVNVFSLTTETNQQRLSGQERQMAF